MCQNPKIFSSSSLVVRINDNNNDVHYYDWASACAIVITSLAFRKPLSLVSFYFDFEFSSSCCLDSFTLKQKLTSKKLYILSPTGCHRTVEKSEDSKIEQFKRSPIDQWQHKRKSKQSLLVVVLATIGWKASAIRYDCGHRSKQN